MRRVKHATGSGVSALKMYRDSIQCITNNIRVNSDHIAYISWEKCFRILAQNSVTRAPCLYHGTDVWRVAYRHKRQALDQDIAVSSPQYPAPSVKLWN